MFDTKNLEALIGNVNDEAGKVLEEGIREVAAEHGVTDEAYIQTAIVFMDMWSYAPADKALQGFIYDLIDRGKDADRVMKADKGLQIMEMLMNTLSDSIKEKEGDCCGGSCKSDGQ